MNAIPPAKYPELRRLRRCALLLFPSESLNEETIDAIAGEGFTDIGLAVVMDARSFTNQGFSEEEGRAVAGMAQERGLGVVAFTGYMKYQEDLLKQEPQRGMVLSDGQGNLRSFTWLCPFRSENVSRYLHFLKQIAEWEPLREIHLNDEASLGFGPDAIGCYCDSCIDEFAEAYGAPPPRSPDWGDDLWWMWVQHRMDRWVWVHSELRSELKRLRPDLLVGIQHSSVAAGFYNNPWMSGISLARDAMAMDLLAIDPYHYNHMRYYPYRPHRRILAEVTRAVLGATVGRCTSIYTQGFSPPGQSIELGRQDGLLEGLVPMALGAGTVMPYAYELMKIIPDFFEGLVDSFAMHSWLERTQPWHYVSVLCPLQSEIYGYPREAWGRGHLTAWAELMNRTGMPWRWIWDQRLEDWSETVKGPLVVPHAHCLTKPQREVIQQIEERGEGVLWVGAVPTEDWRGSGACLPTPIEEGIFELEVGQEDSPLPEPLHPVFLEDMVKCEAFKGEVLGTVASQDALIIDEAGKRAWIAGRPVHSFIRQDDHPVVRTPTGGVSLIQHLIRWLASEEPRFELSPFPPRNAYGLLRPWDARDQPTMELFPLVGEDLSLAIIFHYMRMAYTTELILRGPTGKGPRSIEELWSSRQLACEVSDGTVRCPLNVSPSEELIAVAVEWK